MMNPYAFWAKLLGLGLVAGTAFATVKLVEKFWPKADGEDEFEYIAVAGEFPEDANAEDEPCADAGEDDAAEVEDAPCTGEAAGGTEPEAVPAAEDTPNENPVDAPPAAPETDPLKIADPADFQAWDDLGCQG